ncbi:MAG: mechanosensitive ion channel [Deltaproteobacteria bacterium]|nr:mechanosensitive ion channel [Deltaproteobacteria bacterium]
MEWLIGNGAWRVFSGWAQHVLAIEPVSLGKILNTLLVFSVFFLLKRLVRREVLLHIDAASMRYRVSKVVSLLLSIILVLTLGKVWFAGLHLAAYFGVLSAGLAIALKDPLVNIAGWFFVMIRRPFVIGDRIQIGSQSGDVVDIRLFNFTLLEVGNWVHADQSTGRIVHMPNGQVFNEPVANYTEGFEYIWNEMPVVVTFESDYQRAHELLTEIVERHASGEDEVASQVESMADSYKVSYHYLTPIVWLEVADIGVKLTLRYLCKVRQRRSTADRLWRDVLAAFSAETNIDFAYPTWRFFDHHKEGKEAVAQHTKRV